MSEKKDVYTLADLRNWSEATGSLEHPVRLAVIGDPVSHSRSPEMHNPALRAAGLACEYVRLHLRPEELHEGIAAMQAAGFIGFNATIPHKAAVFERLDEISETARRVGAANTVAFQRDRIVGHNTDAPGLARAVEEAFGGKLGDHRVLLVGAGGGAGRGAAVQCVLDRCPRLVLVNRTVAKAESLAAELSGFADGTEIRSVPWESAAIEREIGEVDLVLNASSVGMQPGDPVVVEGRLLGDRHSVYDLIYAPERTRLLQEAEAAGARVSNGLGMLLWQGALAFEFWFDEEAPLEAMRAGLAGA